MRTGTVCHSKHINDNSNPCMKTTNFLSKLLFLACVFAFPLILSSCNDDEPEDNPGIPGYTEPAKQTLLMYMPWSGGGRMYQCLLDNILSFEKAIEKNRGTDGNALLVFISSDKNLSNLIRIYYENGKCHRDTLKQYDFSTCDYTKAEGITSIINDAMEAAPAEQYAMAIGCHGTGWIPAGTNVGTRSSRMRMQVQPRQLTRFFGTGDGGDKTYQTDITTLADGIMNAGVKMKYILFDDCYMSNIEIAYDLKNVTNYLIASTCEIMLAGMPYAEIGIDLLKNNFNNVVNKFYEYYSNYSTPCGTIGVTDCREVENMAYIMRKINETCPDLPCDVTALQDLDGYENTIFFDFGDYVSHLYIDPSLADAFNNQLERLVPYKAHTETYYSMYTGKRHPINTFSGITISDPSVNRSISNVKTQTNWYRDTH